RVIDERQPLADEAVEQRRFPDIGPADNGEAQTHGGAGLARESCRRGAGSAIAPAAADPARPPSAAIAAGAKARPPALAIAVAAPAKAPPAARAPLAPASRPATRPALPDPAVAGSAARAAWRRCFSSAWTFPARPRWRPHPRPAGCSAARLTHSAAPARRLSPFPASALRPASRAARGPEPRAVPSSPCRPWTTPAAP